MTGEGTSEMFAQQNASADDPSHAEIVDDKDCGRTDCPACSAVRNGINLHSTPRLKAVAGHNVYTPEQTTGELAARYRRWAEGGVR